MNEHSNFPDMQNIHFIDIETVRQRRSFKEIDPAGFKKKFDHWHNELNSWEDLYIRHAGLFAEFGKIISVSVGVMRGEKFFIKTVTGDNEMMLLEELDRMLNPNEATKPAATTLAGHNIKEFDIPFIMRRFIIKDLPIPGIINTWGKNQFQLPFMDTMVLWSGTQWKHMASLDLLCELLDIPAKKSEHIRTGADIGEVYYSITDDNKKEIMQQIGQYNAGDVLSAARLYARLKRFAPIKDENVTYIQI